MYRRGQRFAESVEHARELARGLAGIGQGCGSLEPFQRKGGFTFAEVLLYDMDIILPRLSKVRGVFLVLR